MHTYIIAEIGQNHNGDPQLARKLIDVAAMPIFDFFTGDQLPGVDAVKFTRRDLDEEMTDEMANRPYLSPNSFGATYLEHRRALELPDEQHAELARYARTKGLGFIETLCSPGCLRLLEKTPVDAIKIASRDVTNIPLLQAIAATDHRVILSTGMCTLDELDAALAILSARPRDVVILHCISEYPARYENMNLRALGFLQQRYPNHTIGYSDHSIGIVMPAVAVALGAKVIEKHITLNRNMKGSDHAGSLEPEGLWRVVRDIRNTEKALGQETKSLHPAVAATREKLARSLALALPLRQGETLRETYLCMRSPGSGLPWDERTRLLGKKARRDLPANSLLREEDFS